MDKTCIACGMPMRNQNDFAQSDLKMDYCKHCANSDGTMQSYDQKLESLTGFMVKAQGLDESQARKSVKTMMSKLPAWQNH